MLLKMFSVFDHKSKLFSQPFFSPQTASGVRAFSSECNNPQSDFFRFPGDYELFEIGVWDDNSSKLESTGIESLGLAAQYADKTGS